VEEVDEVVSAVTVGKQPPTRRWDRDRVPQQIPYKIAYFTTSLLVAEEADRTVPAMQVELRWAAAFTSQAER
jgi:hypothetical protein